MKPYLCIFATLVMTTLNACTYMQQQQHDRVMQEVIQFNEQQLDIQHADALRRHAEDYAHFKKLLRMAVKAAYVRERGDCCCTGAELAPISPCPLSKKEFDEVMELLSQAQFQDPPRREDITPEEVASATWDKEDGWKLNVEFLPPVIPIPWANLLIDKLQLQNARGEEVLAIGYHLDEAKGQNYINVNWGNLQSEYRHARLKLQGDSYSRFRNSPARLRFKEKVDKADK